MPDDGFKSYVNQKLHKRGDFSIPNQFPKQKVKKKTKKKEISLENIVFLHFMKMYQLFLHSITAASC